ncbi:MAG: NTP transferase domain-containing protein [Planctomycetota bacterium]|nr:NTP transferase domain-containing protein [Planctomycetota bacterium]
MTRRHFSIIPAAGKSARMGTQKLLLPWPRVNQQGKLDANWTILDQVLSAWETSRTDEIVIVLRKPDRDSPPETHQRLLEICQKYRVHTLAVGAPPDMKASVLEGWRWLGKRFQPVAEEHCFVSTADLPGLNPSVINRMILEGDPRRVTVPWFGGKRGHPALFPWNLLKEVEFLPPDQGINQLVNCADTLRIQFPQSEHFADVDTIEDYDELLKRMRQISD